MMFLFVVVRAFVSDLFVTDVRDDTVRFCVARVVDAGSFLSDWRPGVFCPRSIALTLLRHKNRPTKIRQTFLIPYFLIIITKITYFRQGVL